MQARYASALLFVFPPFVPFAVHSEMNGASASAAMASGMGLHKWWRWIPQCMPARARMHIHSTTHRQLYIILHRAIDCGQGLLGRRCQSTRSSYMLARRQVTKVSIRIRKSSVHGMICSSKLWRADKRCHGNADCNSRNVLRLCGSAPSAPRICSAHPLTAVHRSTFNRNPCLYNCRF